MVDPIWTFVIHNILFALEIFDVISNVHSHHAEADDVALAADLLVEKVGIAR